jgi:hypothetical protein
MVKGDKQGKGGAVNGLHQYRYHVCLQYYYLKRYRRVQVLHAYVRMCLHASQTLLSWHMAAMMAAICHRMQKYHAAGRSVSNC